VYTYNAAEQTVTVAATMVNGKYPVQEDFVRLTKGGGSWKFKRIDANHTALEYYYLGDPGGTVPGWLANTAVTDSPFQMLLNLHKLVKLERYQGKNFSFIR
ncbi:hypothetical protein ACFLR1_06285, partial [Bacteroidota bacterium]